MSDKHPAFAFLGYHVEELTTGIKGYVTQITEYASGLVQCTVQPKGNGENNPDPWGFDTQTLKRSDTTEHPPVIVVPTTVVPYPLKSEVVVDLSQFKGRVKSIHTFLNGCVGYTILGPDNKEGKEQSRFALHESVGLVKEIIKEGNSTLTPPVKRTGGPATRSPRL